MFGWHHQLDVHESEQAPGAGDRQGSLECCSLWGCKESDRTEQLNYTEPVSQELQNIPYAGNGKKRLRGVEHILKAHSVFMGKLKVQKDRLEI